MSMFCFQCQETLGNKGCTMRGMCGKYDYTAKTQDLLISMMRSLAFWNKKAIDLGIAKDEQGLFIMQCLFTTITNANHDTPRILEYVKQAIDRREKLRKLVIDELNKKGEKLDLGNYPDELTWLPENDDSYLQYAEKVGVLRNSNEDIRSLKELITLGLKGIGAYGDHAAMLGYENKEIYQFMTNALAFIENPDATVPELIDWVFKAGENAVKVMALLSEANTTTYGHPEISKVNIGVGKNPGILISGHDLKDMDELLKQTEGTGVDVYTHSEMLPANYYPAFKKYKHFVGNYGSSWWHQQDDFTNFNGPVLMTTNCIVPIKDTYKDRIFTTGMAGYDNVPHIEDRKPGGQKDFSKLIELAKKCPPPTEIETGEIIGGFGHNTVLSVADKVIELVKAGKIKRFVVMAGCDGRHKERSYFTEVAENLPKDTIILTAGCAKYRYIKLPLGDIEGIPRVLDAGQCNDSYSLAVIALKLQEAFGLGNINDLPLSFDLAWYEQKAVAVLLALLYLGVKNIHIGPTIPAFLSPAVVNVLVENFNIQAITEPKNDIDLMMAGK